MVLVAAGELGHLKEQHLLTMLLLMRRLRMRPTGQPNQLTRSLLLLRKNLHSRWSRPLHTPGCASP